MVLLFVGFTIRYLYEYRKYLLDIYYIQNISMCRNTEKKCMHYENGIKDEKNIWKNLSLTWHNQAKSKGVYKGRKPIQIDNEQFVIIYTRWKANEITARQAMLELNIKANTFYRRVKEYETNKKAISNTWKIQ